MIDPGAFVHPLAFVCGDVVLGAGASVWPYAVVRGDNDRITIGAESNVQDGAVLHADPGLPCVLGERVSVGHRAVVHGAIVEDEVLVGMGALVLNGARIGSGSIVGAGAELNLDVALQYDVAYRFRLGAAAPVAGRTPGARRPSVYVTLGSSF